MEDGKTNDRRERTAVMSDWDCINCGDNIYEKDQHPKFTEDGEGPYCEDCFDEMPECDICGKKITGEAHHLDPDLTVCDECYDDYQSDAVCDICGKPITGEQYFLDDDTMVCEECYEEYQNGAECEICGKEIINEQYFLEDGTMVCEECYEEYQNGAECDICGNSIEGEQYFLDDETMVCEDCYNKYQNGELICDVCGNAIEGDVYITDNDMVMCEECYEEYQEDAECDICGATITGEKYFLDDDTMVCEDCYDRLKDGDWVCESCGKELDPMSDESKYFTSEGDGPYCEDCFCEECFRPKDECICDQLFSGEDLDLDPDYNPPIDVDGLPEVDFDEINETLNKIMPDLQQSLSFHGITDWEGTILTYNVLSSLLNFTPNLNRNIPATIDSFIDSLRRGSENRAVSARYDSFSRDSEAAKYNMSIRYIEALERNKAINDKLENDFNWLTSFKWNQSKDQKIKEEFTQKTIKHLDQLMELLKNLAIEIGYPKEKVNKIKFKIDRTGRLIAENCYGRTSGAEIEMPIEGFFNGGHLAQSFVHEFQHALDNIWTEGKSIHTFRYHVAEHYYHPPKASEPQDVYDVKLVAYFCNLIEGTAIQAEYAASEKFGQFRTVQMYFLKQYGYWALPAILEWINTTAGFTGEKMLFLNLLSQIVPEIALMPGDFDMQGIKKLDRRHFDRDFNSGEYFYQITGKNGTTYVVPTQKYLDELKEAVGAAFNPEDFFHAIWGYLSDQPAEYGNMSYKEMIKAVIDDEYFHVSPAGENGNGSRPRNSSSLPMTADAFTACIAIAELLSLYNGVEGTEDEDKLEKILEEMLDKTEEIESLMDLGSEVEDLCADAENIISDMEFLQDELSDLADEYSRKTEEFEEVKESAQEMLEGLIEDIRSECDSIMDNPADIQGDPEDIRNDLESRFSAAKEDVSDETDAALQGIADDLEELAAEIEDKISELESLESELEDLTGEIEDKSDEMERYGAIAAELDDLEDLIRKKMRAGNLNRHFECRIDVTTVDQNDEPLFGIPVIATDPENEMQFTLGFTDDEGFISAAVDTRTFSGWTLIVNGNTAEARSGSFPYKSQKETGLNFIVRMEDNEPVFVIEHKFVMEKKEQTSAGTKEQKATLKVTIRGDRTSNGILPSATAGTRGKSVTWKEYYEYWLSTRDIVQDGKSTANPAYASMTAENADYYGAYLLPMSNAGELPRVNGKTIFSPLYRMKNNKPVLQLVNSSDYSFASKAFDFGTIQPGRYELVIIMPIPSCSYYFGSITVNSGETKKVKAENWNPEGKPASEYDRNTTKYKTIELDTEIYIKDGGHKLQSRLSRKDYGTLFALSVDARGKKLWSVIEYASPSRIKVPVYYGWHDSAWRTGREGNHIEPCAGQIYLLFGNKRLSCNIFPVTYLYLYMEYRDEFGKFHGRTFERFMPGRVYGEALAGAKMHHKAYVAFWEQYHDAQGNIHYRTYNDPVAFELHWPVDEYFEDVLDDEIHLIDAVPGNKNGKLANYLSQRKIMNSGASYVFAYTKKNNDICNGVAFNRIPSWYAAEQITMEDELWEASGIEYRLTGTAQMKSFKESENGIPIMRNVRIDPIVFEDEDGTVLRFIVGSDEEVDPPSREETRPVVTTEDYYINRNTGKFHLPSCGSKGLIVDKNLSRIVFKDRKAQKTMKETLMAFEFKPCLRCFPNVNPKKKK